MAEKKKSTKKTTAITKALVMQEIQLSVRQTGIIQTETPTGLIKSKPGRGGKRVSYVEGGYVISKLNQAFSPLGWEFKIVEKGSTERQNENNTEGEVWVYGELTIIDHKNGYRTTKGQYGQHPIHKKVPIGDAYKAAGTDSLKKCASLIGIALDVYWGQLDAPEDKPKDDKPSKEELFERAKVMVAGMRNVGGLIEYSERLKDSKNFNAKQIAELQTLINATVGKLEEKDNA